MLYCGVQVARCAIFRGVQYPALTYTFLAHHNRSMATSSSGVTLETLKFDNKALRSLPVDKNTSNTRRPVPNACFSRVSPEHVTNPQLVAHSPSALKLFGLAGSEIEKELFLKVFSGNEKLPGFDTAAHCYCGHQFGSFSGQLGDGAAMLV